MPKVNVYLSDRLAEAVRAYDIPLSPVCQQALEQEVAARMGVLSLTPRSRRVLAAAAREAKSFGENFIGTEHLLLGLIAEEDGIAAQALSALDVIDAVRAKVNEMIGASRGRESNRAVDKHGNLIGYMVEGEDGNAVIVTRDGHRVQFGYNEQGESVALDEAGRPVPLLPASEAPRMVEFDDGGPVVLVDEKGHRVKRQ